MANTPSKSTKFDMLELTLPVWSHTEVKYWAPEWKKIRDCLLGEVEIKLNTTTYLPQMSGMDASEYSAYLDRATFFNMTARTTNALLGTIFKRSPVLNNLPSKLEPGLASITKDRKSFKAWQKEVTHELITVGRVGVLVDIDPEGKHDPYFANYSAENILDWDVEDIDGKMTLTRVVLREIHTEKKGDAEAREHFVSYRVLSLNDGIYSQHIYRDAGEHATLDGTRPIVVTPTMRGKPFDFIPFLFLGSTNTDPAIEKAPMLDIARMNLSHYKSSALLEHGTFFCGLPTYFAEVPGGTEGGTYTIGPSMVWQIPTGGKAGIIEMNGQGLKFLENSLDMKEQQIALLGGRLVGIRGSAASLSDNQVSVNEKNENSTLLNIVDVLDEGVTTLLQWWTRWQDVSESASKDVSIEFNKDFLLDGIGSREYRAISSMYKDGIVPIEVVYDYLRKGEMVPDWMQMDEFKTLLDNSASFPNNPDVEAKQAGFDGIKHQKDEERADEEAETAKKAAEEAAKLAKEISQGNQSSVDENPNDPKATTPAIPPKAPK